MKSINTILRKLFDVILYPVRDWSPLLSLAIISLVAGIAMLMVVKVTSNQDKLAEVKRRLARLRRTQQDFRGEWVYLFVETSP